MNFFSAALNIYQKAFRSLGDLFQLISLICGQGAEVSQVLYLLLMNDERYAEVKAEFHAAFSLWLQATGKVISGVAKLKSVPGLEKDLKGANDLIKGASNLIDLGVIFSEVGKAVKEYETQGDALITQIQKEFPEEMKSIIKPEPIEAR